MGREKKTVHALDFNMRLPFATGGAHQMQKITCVDQEAERV